MMRCGRTELKMRPCGIEDLDALMMLQEKICRGMERADWFAVTEREDNETFLTEPNRILGVFDGRRLVAYGSVGFLGAFEENLGWDLGLAEEEVLLCATLDTIVVDPDCRGMGIQRELIRRCVEYAREKQPGCRILATVAPDNIYSLRNVQAEGFEILAQKEKYGGKERYILGV